MANKRIIETPQKRAASAPIERDCDLCGKAQAKYDAPTYVGPWAYMCDVCYQRNASAYAPLTGCIII